MRIKLTHITPLLAAGAVALAIVAAPTAAAAATPLPKTCVATGGGTTCQSPGNVEINNPSPPLAFIPTNHALAARGPLRPAAVNDRATLRQETLHRPHRDRGTPPRHGPGLNTR